MIRNYKGDLYTGITTDVERRFTEHSQGQKKSAKCLRGKGPLTLVFQQSIGNRSLALKAEAAFKKMSKASKEAFIQSNNLIAISENLKKDFEKLEKHED